jgi:hypothetical protein
MAKSKKLNWRDKLKAGHSNNVKLSYTSNGHPKQIISGGADTYGYIGIAVPIKEFESNELKRNDLMSVHNCIDWADKHDYKRYLGIKMDSDKEYESSSTNEDYWKDFINPDYMWHWIIFDWASYQEMQQVENDLLNRYKARQNKIWYNDSNGFPGVDRIRWGFVGEYAQELLWMKNYDLTDRDGQERKFKHLKKEYLTDSPEMPVKELMEMPRCQPRPEEIDVDHVTDIQGDIKKDTYPTTPAAPVIILQDRVWVREGKAVHCEWIILDGNHTVIAYSTFKGKKGKLILNTTNLQTIILPPDVHKVLSQAEIKELGNSMNTLKKRQKPFTKEQAETDLLRMARNGQSWRTPDILKTYMDRGLSEGNVNTVFGKVEQELINDKAKKRGDNVMDYDIIHKKFIDELIEKQMKGNRYAVCYGGSSVKPDEIQKNFWKENEKRILNGDTPYIDIILNVKFSSEKIRDKDWPKIKKKIQYLLSVGEYKTPIHFNELEMYINGLVNVNTISAK